MSWLREQRFARLAATEVVMIFAALLLLCPLAQNGDLARTASEAPVIAATSTVKDSFLSTMPDPKVSTDAEIAAAGLMSLALEPADAVAITVNAPNLVANAAASTPAMEGSAAPNLAPSEPKPGAFPIVPVKPAFYGYYETPRQKKIWYGLAAAGHGAAAFDAWSTRRAVASGYGTEGNPLLRPFSHSAAIYVATQASPLIMDYVGKRMMTSHHLWVRRMWWLPQTAGAGMSLAAGVHNVGVAP